jgi:hypothetical protein
MNKRTTRASTGNSFVICCRSTSCRRTPVRLLFCNAVFLVKLINTSASLSSFLLSCVEWMALRADFYVNLWFCRTCRECITTVTSYSCLVVLWMDTFSHFFHLVNLFHYCYFCVLIFKQLSNYIIIRNKMQVL